MYNPPAWQILRQLSIVQHAWPPPKAQNTLVPFFFPISFQRVRVISSLFFDFSDFRLKIYLPRIICTVPFKIKKAKAKPPIIPPTIIMTATTPIVPARSNLVGTNQTHILWIPNGSPIHIHNRRKFIPSGVSYTDLKRKTVRAAIQIGRNTLQSKYTLARRKLSSGKRTKLRI